MSGKGSDQRPTDHKKFSENYDLIFKKNDKNSTSTERTLAQADTKTETKEKESSA